MKNNSLAILGASGHGKVVANAASLMEDWDEILFNDDRYPEMENVGKYKIVGKISDLLAKKPITNVVIAIGNNETRYELHEELVNNNFNLAVVIHPRSIVAEDVSIDSGTVVFAGAVINSGANVGNSWIINTNSVVEHD